MGHKTDWNQRGPSTLQTPINQDNNSASSSPPPWQVIWYAIMFKNVCVRQISCYSYGKNICNALKWKVIHVTARCHWKVYSLTLFKVCFVSHNGGPYIYVVSMINRNPANITQYLTDFFASISFVFTSLLEVMPESDWTAVPERHTNISQCWNSNIRAMTLNIQCTDSLALLLPSVV